MEGIYKLSCILQGSADGNFKKMSQRHQKDQHKADIIHLAFSHDRPPQLYIYKLYHNLKQM